MKILTVVVVYQMPFSESPTLRGLCDALVSEPDLALGYTVMIWDNSPGPIANPELSIPFLYRHSEVNCGVSGAYNGGIEYALPHGYPWMLLLDQDSEIDVRFLRMMMRHARELEEKTEIAAIVPTVLVRGHPVSPRRQLFLERGRYSPPMKQYALYIARRLRLFERNSNYPMGECGIAHGKAFAINSGCILRVASLQTVGGFSADFWLDYSDMYIFHQFFAHGMKVWRAADVELEHDMAIMDYDRLMTPWRYKNRVCAGSAFGDLYRGRIENAIQTLGCLFRAVKLQIKYGKSEYSQIAWELFIYRLRVPLEERISRWSTKCKMRSTKP